MNVPRVVVSVSMCAWYDVVLWFRDPCVVCDVSVCMVLSFLVFVYVSDFT